MNLLFRPRVARFVAVVALLYGISYLSWRAFATLNPDALAFSLLLLIAEIVGIINFFLFTFDTWKTDTAPPFEKAPGHTVDVYVLAGEIEPEALEATLVACLGVSYPHHTYLLDELGRPDLQEIAEGYGATYLAREDLTGGIAGAINDAMTRTHGEFIAILNGDAVPQPDFIDRTIGYFVDPKVALVQTPREYYNESIVHADRDEKIDLEWHDEALFFRTIEPGKNAHNSAIWMLSPSVIRRAAFRSIGGVATETRSQHMVTTLRILRAGWRTVYAGGEPVSYSIAPQSLTDFIARRVRQAEGAMQILFSKEGPIRSKQLTKGQRLSVLATLSSPLDAFQRLIYVAVPAIVVVSGLTPFGAGILEVLAFWIPGFVLVQLARFALGRGQYRFVDTEQFQFLKLFTHLRAAMILLGSKPQRDHRPGETVMHVALTDRRHLLPHYLLTWTLALCMMIGGLNLAYQVSATQADGPVIFIATLWTLANFLFLTTGIHAVRSRLHQRQSYRFPVSAHVMVTDASGVRVEGSTEDLSPIGAGIVLNVGIRITDEPVTMAIRLPNGPAMIRGWVANARTIPNDKQRIGVIFSEMTPAARRRLLSYLFVLQPRAWHHTESMSMVPGEVVSLPARASNDTSEHSVA